MSRALISGKAIREKILYMIAPLSVAQMNHIPEGFSNNLVWQLGHLAVTPELLFFVRTGLQPDRRVALAQRYRNGTWPEGLVSGEEIEALKTQILTTLDELGIELERHGTDHAVPTFTTTTFNIPTQTLGDTMTLSAHHDALHWGNIMALKKLL